MTLRAQHDYYKLPSAASVLERRIEALAGAIPVGSVILDLGCNDCSISNALVRRGIVSHAFAYDLEDIRQEIHPEVTFTVSDLMEISVSELPAADGVIILNVLHHLIARSPEMAKSLLHSLLFRYKFVVLDMGSFSENGDWGWRKNFDALWSSDPEMWEDLFSSVSFKFKLLRYPTQGNGHRVLWKLCRQGYEVASIESCEKFLKVPGSYSSDKQLIQVSELNESDLENAGNVYFEKIITPQRDLFWRKTYTSADKFRLVQIEYALTQACNKALSSYGCRSISGVINPIMKPVGDSLLYIFEPDLFSGNSVHYQDWLDNFGLSETQDLLRLSAWPIEFQSFSSKIQLLNLTDFQAIRCWDGLKLLDFEPNVWVRELVETWGGANVT